MSSSKTGATEVTGGAHADGADLDWADDPRPFDLLGELPTGTMVLEASAGTGKTFAIAGLAVRYVAEGRARLDQLMIVTFGRAATDELRGRVRERLVSLLHGLGRVLHGEAAGRVASDVPAGMELEVVDALLVHLSQGARMEAEARWRRLRHAVATFDSATITTTHGMCDMLLRSLGLAADRDPEAELTDDAGDLIEEVLSDVYLRRYGFADPHGHGPSFDEATRLASDVAGNPEVALEPHEPPNLFVEERVTLARWLRAGLGRRRAMYHLMDFDDLLTLAASALADSVLGGLACGRIRSRYEVILVDEFQDTDPIQWEILRRAFHGHRTLVLVGDPKQAIYAFRGGDVETYLSATREASGHVLGLAENYRSDPGLVAGVAALMRHAALGHPQIRVRPILARRAGARIAGSGATPVHVRWFSREGLGCGPTRLPKVGAARAAVVADVVSQVAQALDGTRRFEGRCVQPADVAVLVRTNVQGESIRSGLVDAGIPAVMHSTSTVFATRGAREWLTLLEAVERPRDTARVRAAALGIFGGWTAPQVATTDGTQIEVWRSQLRRWARLLEIRGVAALLEQLISSSGVQTRALATLGGERLMTDLRHVGQILHETSIENRFGTMGLAGWLSRQVSGAARAANRPRRLESDAKAVQVVTVHRSKGLEFPVVFVPFGWDRFDKTDASVLRYHHDGHRRLHVGGKTDPGYANAEKAARAEDLGEELRLLYVALTRASGQVVLWWAPSTNTPTSALHRLLFGEADLTGQVPDKTVVPKDDAILTRLTAFAASEIAVTEVEPRTVSREFAPASGLNDTTTPLAVRVFDRRLDPAWRRTSYSGITASAHSASTASTATSEPDDAVDVDEPQTASPMGGLPAGPVLGTYVHAVLETVNTDAADLRLELIQRAREVGSAAWAFGLELTADHLADALLPVMHTPLGPFTRAGDRELTLAEVSPHNRLSELTFEFPLAGGDFAEAGSGATIKDIADLVEQHLPESHPLRDYPRRLRTAGLGEQQLRGYLNGSIDSVLRIEPDGRPRYVVVDYKTNWLGQWQGQVLSARDYRQEALAAAMMDSHYPLQALLYCVALHRFLSWRQPDYEVETHLGGVLYLFLRGMTGPDAPSEDGWRTGVFGWDPPATLIRELSVLLGEEL